MAPLQETLVGARGKYHDLLCSGVAAQARPGPAARSPPPRAARHPPRTGRRQAPCAEAPRRAPRAQVAQGPRTAPAMVRDAAAAAELAALGLPLAADAGAAPPQPPFAAPYTGMVPLVLRAARECAAPRGAAGRRARAAPAARARARETVEHKLAFFFLW